MIFLLNLNGLGLLNVKDYDKRKIYQNIDFHIAVVFKENKKSCK